MGLPLQRRGVLIPLPCFNGHNIGHWSENYNSRGWLRAWADSLYCSLSGSTHCPCFDNPLSSSPAAALSSVCCTWRGRLHCQTNWGSLWVAQKMSWCTLFCYYCFYETVIPGGGRHIHWDIKWPMSWRKDPCYFETELEKEHRCTLGHHLGPRSATMLRMEPNFFEWSQWQHFLSPCLGIPEFFTKTFYWAVVVLHSVTTFHTKLQLSVSIPGFVCQKTSGSSAPTTNWWQCVGSGLVNVAPLAPQHCILWWSWAANSTRSLACASE